MKRCLTRGCQRAPRQPESGVVFAHCDTCTRRLLREAFGPVSWHDRARSMVLPPMVSGGVEA